MALLPILRYPDPRLHTVAKPVAEVDDRIRQLVDDMLATIDTSEERNEPRVLINPEITWASDEMIVWEEGCLSVPTIYDKVDRHARVKVRALNRDGQTHEFEADELLAVCVQHELDHLLGKVFVEYLSPFKRNRIKTKLVKRAKEDA